VGLWQLTNGFTHLNMNSQTIVLGSVLQVIAYAIQSSAPPFPVFIMAYTINGIGGALEVSTLPVVDPVDG